MMGRSCAALLHRRDRNVCARICFLSNYRLFHRVQGNRQREPLFRLPGCPVSPPINDLLSFRVYVSASDGSVVVYCRVNNPTKRSSKESVRDVIKFWSIIFLTFLETGDYKNWKIRIGESITRFEDIRDMQ